MTIQEYFGDWSEVIDLNEADRLMRRLNALSCQENKVICPQLKDIFKAFRLCPLNALRLVILGQDPYSDSYNRKPRATGVAFANSPDTPVKFYLLH